MEKKIRYNTAAVPSSGGGILAQYASFNHWAHQKILEAINTLTEEQLHQEIISSFPSIFKTMLHIWDAESMWWQRLKLEEHVERPSASFTGNVEDLQKKILHQSAQYEHWVINATEHQLQHVFAYISHKEQHKIQVCQMLLHLFNHNSYHRGQIVTMLRQLGVTKIPNTDFNGYLKSHKK